MFSIDKINVEWANLNQYVARIIFGRRTMGNAMNGVAWHLGDMTWMQ